MARAVSQLVSVSFPFGWYAGMVYLVFGVLAHRLRGGLCRGFQSSFTSSWKSG